MLVAFVWDVTSKTIDLPLGCLQGGLGQPAERDMACRARFSELLWHNVFFLENLVTKTNTKMVCACLGR
jgi:hypothetical protein